MTDLAISIDDAIRYAAEGNLESLKEAPNLPSIINSQNAFGHTILISACRAGQLEVVLWLLEAGADPNLTNFKGTTPLMYAKTDAFASGQSNIMNALIEAGADVRAVDDNGLTALDYTRRRADFLISYLIEKGS